MKLEEITALFFVANIPVIAYHQLVNQYDSRQSDETPWWLVETELGRITVGWRKRVINIDWSQTDYRNDKLVSDDTTKTETYVHAWTKVKAAQYLNLLYMDMQRNSIHEKKQCHTALINIDCGPGLKVPDYIVNRALTPENINRLIQAEINKDPGAVDDNRKIQAD